MPKEKFAKCPFYVTRSRKGKQRATITCDQIENRLGFTMKNQLFFDCHEEKENYFDIFCSDMYDTCPYYKSIYQYKFEK